MSRSSHHRAPRIAALSIGVSVALSAMAANAQEPPQEVGRQATTLDRVEVLGSRIRRVEGETALPVLTLQRADIERTGLTQLGELVKELHVNGPSISLNTNNSNTSGNSGVNLRNCGANRTLVLVDGKRWVSNNGLGGAVDFSSIPLAAVERIEVLKDGASAVYGSDALCGVVNIHTRRNVDGAVGRAYFGQYGKGDGTRQSYDFTVGGAGDRWSTVLNVSYTDQKPVFAGDREISAVPLYGFPANVSSPGRASPGGPYGNYNVPGRGVVTLDPGSAGCQPNQVCSSAVAETDFRRFNFLTDGYNFAVDNFLSQPQTVRSAFALAQYDLTSNISFVSDVFYSKRTGSAQLAAQPLNPITISADSVYNPFGVTIVGGNFRPTDFPRQFGQDQDTWRFSGGLEGTFDVGDRMFFWDAGYTYAHNRQVQPKNGFYFAQRLQQALGPSFIDAGGVARCGTPSAPIVDCVPVNVMGGPSGYTQEMHDYISVNPKNVMTSEQESIVANLSGDLFDLPGGTMAFAVGLEHRKEAGSSEPDTLTALGQVLGDNPFLPTNGQYSVDEIYAELQIPLLREVAFARSLEVSLAARYSDYDSFGDTTNPKFSLRWQPIDDLLVRGAWGKGFRAPSINELYAGVGSGRPPAQDPCSATSVAFQQSAGVRARCAADGVPAGYVASSVQTRASSGGNVNLQPELSTQKTLGFVYSPAWMPSLDFSVDWYNIRISNQISSLTAQAILNACYVAGNAAQCANISRDIDGSVFGNPGEVADIQTVSQNFAGGLEIEGFDIGAGYRFSNTMGDFDIRWDTTYVSYYGDIGKPSRGDVNADGVISDGNLIGTLPANNSAGAPRWRIRSQLSATWSNDRWSMTGTLHFMSKVRQSCLNVYNTAMALANAVDPSYEELKYLCSDWDRVIDQYQFDPDTGNVVAVSTHTPSHVLGSTAYFDLQGSWKAPWNGKVTLGVRNLFGRNPPFAPDAQANSYDPQYRIPGSFYYMSYEQRF